MTAQDQAQVAGRGGLMAAALQLGRYALAALCGLWLPMPAQAQGVAEAATLPPARLTARDIGLVINMRDPYSVQVGRHYARQRGLQGRQVLRLELPVRDQLTPQEFEAFKAQIDAHFGPRTQALALAWRMPYAVQCHSLPGALALGFDEKLCAQTCAASKPSPYVQSNSTRPYSSHGMRISMLLAAADEAQALAMIDRGVAADRSLAWRGGPPAQALLLQTNDKARNVRAALYPPAGLLRSANLQVQKLPARGLPDQQRVVVAQTGSARIDGLAHIDWLPGGLGDHLTSFGGVLAGGHGQSTALDWVAAGATASHGTVSEPCNHWQKFPHPQWLLRHYAAGATAIEAYWKSVAWPQQSLFIGEPLAAPFARR